MNHLRNKTLTTTEQTNRKTVSISSGTYCSSHINYSHPFTLITEKHDCLNIKIKVLLGTVAVHTFCLQYIPRNMHTVFALLCFVVVIHWLIFPYPSGLLHWHCGNLTIAPVPAKQPWWIWINTSCEFIMNDCITTTKQSTTKPCAYFSGYTVCCCLILIHPRRKQWLSINFQMVKAR